MMDDPTPVRLSVGHVVVLPRDEIHAVSDRTGRQATPVAAIAGLDRRNRRATTFTYGGGGVRTQPLTASFAADMRCRKWQQIGQQTASGGHFLLGTGNFSTFCEPAVVAIDVR